MGPTTVSILISMAGPHLSHLLDPAWCRHCQLLMGGTGYLCGWLYDPGNPNPDLLVGRAQSHGGWLQGVGMVVGGQDVLGLVSVYVGGVEP